MDFLNQEATEETPEDLELELEVVERELAAKYGLRGSVRRELLKRLKTGEVSEEGPVVQWLALYASLVARLRSDRPPLKVSGIGEKEAAPGAAFFFARRSVQIAPDAEWAMSACRGKRSRTRSIRV